MQTVVGYNQPAVNAGHALRTVSFVTIDDSDKFDVADIVPMSATLEGEDLDGKIALLQIDEHGASVDGGTFAWANWGDPDVGWQFADDFIAKGEHLFDAGTAFWTQVNSAVSDMTLQCSGAVSPKDVTFVIPEGISVGGNPFPANVDLSTVFPISATLEGEDLDGSVALLKIDENGASVDGGTYSWANWGDPDVGWQYQDDFIQEGEHFMIPGQSFWISVTQNRGFTDLKLYMPCPYTLGK